MNKGDMIELNMCKVLGRGNTKDVKTYHGMLQEYHEKEGQMNIILQEGALSELSLDALYTCMIHSQTGKIGCTGRIKERYCGKIGKTLVFHIDNGFYKINVN